MKAHAVVFAEKLKVAYKEVELPEPKQDEVLIDVDYSWISIGTESSYLRCERIGGETPFREGDPNPYPQVSGYQKVGTITWVGDQVQGLEVGEKVFATMSRMEGMFYPSGGHVSPALTHCSEVWKLPPNADSITYSGLVLTQVGYNCGTRPPVTEGDYAVVIGEGLVGQWTAQTLQRRGAKVIVLGRHDDRLALLPDGVTGVKRSADIRIQEALGAAAGKIAIIVDTVGSLAAVTELFDQTQLDCHIVSAGFLGEEGRIDIQLLRHREATLHSPSGWNRRRMDATLQGIEEGWLQPKPLITHILPVEQATVAWELILDRTKPKLGVVLDWRK
ncbi:hypothetical protein [Paenibacillus sp. GCM10027626]|uniref:hypothetical protein n=1 Tax=Paenibacillus sp. GCM10027626 TaxID=3273411 RepID=UPI003642783D